MLLSLFMNVTIVDMQGGGTMGGYIVHANGNGRATPQELKHPSPESQKSHESLDITGKQSAMSVSGPLLHHAIFSSCWLGMKPNSIAVDASIFIQSMTWHHQACMSKLFHAGHKCAASAAEMLLVMGLPLHCGVEPQKSPVNSPRSHWKDGVQRCYVLRLCRLHTLNVER